VKTFSFFLLFFLALLPSPVQSKNRYFNKPFNFSIHTPNRTATLEERFRPYLENRFRNRLHPHIKSPTNEDSGIPNSIEIMMLARSWSSLSEEFKSLYISALLFPDNFIIFNSPGGHFEVHYTTKGIDSVSPVDLYHYSPAPPYNRVSQPNGIPDYVDETAWALDSAWRMEVDKFGFQQPFPYKDSLRSSDRYKVLIQSPGENEEEVYGYTMFYQKIGNNSFSSFIIMRNEWSGFNTEPLKYDTDPSPAIHVTCAHEFFHAIQYAMTWDIVNSSMLDDFPLTWTEGCATTMEELAFPNVDDYVQYTMPYFSKPSISFFSKEDNTDYNRIYLRSLFLIYATTRLWNDSNAGFFREMYTNNFEAIVPFRENITKSLSKIALTWPVALNKFHTASYFTGSRSDTTIFLADAGEFVEWSPVLTSPQTVSIAENSVGIFSIKRQNTHYDTLFIKFEPEDDWTELDSWAGSVILHQDKSARIIPVALNQDGKGTLIVPDWKTQDECIAVISSGFSQSARKYNVDFTPCTIMHISGTNDTVFGSQANSIHPYAIVHACSDLRCDLTISRTTITNRMASIALLNNIQLADSLFSIDFPLTWKDSANITLCIDSTPKELKIFKWQQDSLTWNQLPDSSTNDGNIKVVISDIGIYGCFTSFNAVEEKTIIAFPNPAHISNGNGMVTCEGYDVKAVTIYTMNGSLIHQVSINDLQSSSLQGMPQMFYWKLHNRQGTPLSPGVYTMVTQYSGNKKSKITKTKILLIP
jgi:hypothetical protein